MKKVLAFMLCCMVIMGQVCIVRADYMTNFPNQNRTYYVQRYTRGLQVMLYDHKSSYDYIKYGGVDGSYGEMTESAVIAFQKNRNITADGKCGKQTWTKLRDTLKLDRDHSTSNTSYYYMTGNISGTNRCMYVNVSKNTWYCYNKGTWYYVG